MKNWKAVSLSPLFIHNWHVSVMVPSLFSDPSTFQTILGSFTGVVPSPSFFIRSWSIRLSVAPLSRSTLARASL